MTDTEARLRGCRAEIALSIEILEGELGISAAMPITFPLLNACQQIENALREQKAKTATT